MKKNLPLEGIRVVEFSHMVMGPSCGLVLADLGAEVIKVEPLGKGDPTRYLTSTGAGFFSSFNRNNNFVWAQHGERAAKLVRRNLLQPNNDGIEEGHDVGCAPAA